MCLFALHMQMLFEVIGLEVCLMFHVFLEETFHRLRRLGLHFPISSYRRFMWSLSLCFYAWTFNNEYCGPRGFVALGCGVSGLPWVAGAAHLPALPTLRCCLRPSPRPRCPCCPASHSSPIGPWAAEGTQDPALGVGSSLWFPACLCSSLLPGRVLTSRPLSVSVDGTKVAAHWNGCPSPLSLGSV